MSERCEVTGGVVHPSPPVNAGKRYNDCRFENFLVASDEHVLARQTALDTCIEYAREFGGEDGHYEKGHSLVIYGPKGTGKDHLMLAVLYSLRHGYKVDPARFMYAGGLMMMSDFRDAIKSSDTEHSVVKTYADADVLAISDPVPPIGELSEYEKRMMYRVLDSRYRELRPTLITANVADRVELERRLGPQATDRLCEDAVIVRCNWPSYRQSK